MDEFTRRHLDAWLFHQIVNEDRRAAVRTAMVEHFNTDVEYWSMHGWTELYDHIGAYHIEAQ